MDVGIIYIYKDPPPRKFLAVAINKDAYCRWRQQLHSVRDSQPDSCCVHCTDTVSLRVI